MYIIFVADKSSFTGLRRYLRIFQSSLMEQKVALGCSADGACTNSSVTGGERRGTSNAQVNEKDEKGYRSRS